MQIIQLHISLERSKPSIWRRIVVPANFTFYELHHSIQIAMGWQNYHMFEFHLGLSRIGIAELAQEDFEEIPEDSETILLGDRLQKGDSFKYVYDFGDDWVHEIKVESISDSPPGVKYPICISGVLHCPAEDSGGMHGYYEYLKIINQPRHPEYKEVKTWLGKNFNPNEFDIVKANKVLGSLKSYIRKWAKESEMN